MPALQLIADSGATKTNWCLIGEQHGPIAFNTQGINPYFFSGRQITEIIQKEFPPKVLETPVSALYFYGAGCGAQESRNLVAGSIKQALPLCNTVNVESDVLGAAKALCGTTPGVVGILGTGSNSCVFDGRSITRNNPAPGFILGDEGSGAALGKKVLQYFIYHTFDDELEHLFVKKYNITYPEILEKVYKVPHPNRFLSSFAPFLSENRGHYMIENIIEDGLSEFFFTHLYKYVETWTHPLHFSGSIAYVFRDVIADICHASELQPGRILKQPMDGLVAYHLEHA
jgi:N-acetylglucosamine kinase-like BadF-type ATPase